MSIETPPSTGTSSTIRGGDIPSRHPFEESCPSAANSCPEGCIPSVTKNWLTICADIDPRSKLTGMSNRKVFIVPAIELGLSKEQVDTRNFEGPGAGRRPTTERWCRSIYDPKQVREHILKPPTAYIVFFISVFLIHNFDGASLLYSCLND
ncbi:hypothetical protein PGT21_005085 [Puccinia graminis f. sp. tritici]|uniref:Uncharacterized protein n=1 Tax=Puccinia graminis f. sp. tritici TaxID=56615 RepID=A0A5B0LZD1_PUCGR|nr:hypothetical protein PGT21_005085 [Puccinia graminis f. sp. tritici]